jgi:hypothetical protein
MMATKTHTKASANGKATKAAPPRKGPAIVQQGPHTGKTVRAALRELKAEKEAIHQRAREMMDRNPILAIDKDRLLTLTAAEKTLWTLLSEGGADALWAALTQRIHVAIERLDNFDVGPERAELADVAEAMTIRGLIDALFALECAVNEVERISPADFDEEAKIRERVAKGGAK